MSGLWFDRDTTPPVGLRGKRKYLSKIEIQARARVFDVVS